MVIGCRSPGHPSWPAHLQISLVWNPLQSWPHASLVLANPILLVIFTGKEPSLAIACPILPYIHSLLVFSLDKEPLHSNGKKCQFDALWTLLLHSVVPWNLPSMSLFTLLSFWQVTHPKKQSSLLKGLKVIRNLSCVLKQCHAYLTGQLGQTKFGECPKASSFPPCNHCGLRCHYCGKWFRSNPKNSEHILVSH